MTSIHVHGVQYGTHRKSTCFQTNKLYLYIMYSYSAATNNVVQQRNNEYGYLLLIIGFTSDEPVCPVTVEPHLDGCERCIDGEPCEEGGREGGRKGESEGVMAVITQWKLPFLYEILLAPLSRVQT